MVAIAADASRRIARMQEEEKTPAQKAVRKSASGDERALWCFERQERKGS
jgi:hypothetical protein